jgi:CheY-like chemotaxis protein
VAADVPAIALSGRRAGFNAYIEKPVDLEKLGQLIRGLATR